ncbi:GntR family transcriptional regulator [Salipiger sp. P9]|uniref:GntR family transcriptional regulator n=1 Tax=Salipiger pentaromativorans TaxID=2943193 RepID=UPI0021582142|nr:GntR family transcriptional regulator [Salipiger pentaromativorans]MCR8547489.1 GntR family transcriptional regulator [Salipiger pentaromativorans]
MPVKRTTLAEQIVEFVRDKISQNLYQPGDKLTIQGLAEELGVSMTPVREALKTLAAERLIELLPNRGAVIARPDPEEITQMLEIYARLDAMAGEMAAMRASEADVAELRALARAVDAAVAGGDLVEYFHANQDFHLGIARVSGNEVLRELHRNLNARLYHVRFRGIDQTAPNSWHSLAAEHHEIVDAIAARDSARAADLLTAHFRGARISAEELRPRAAASDPQPAMQPE